MNYSNYNRWSNTKETPNINIKTRTIKLSEKTSRVKQGRLHMVKKVKKNKDWQIDYIKINTLWYNEN